MGIRSTVQWRIQDFPGRANSKGGGTNLLFWPIFPKSCMKMKKIGTMGEARL